MKKSKYAPLTKYKFEKYRKMVNGDAERNWPNLKSYLEALEMSLTKWHPLRGRNRGETIWLNIASSCGLCMYFRTMDNCDNCILDVDGYCDYFWDWDSAETDEQKNKKADIIYKLILKEYKKELKR
jgi:hypothetical protein